MIDTTETRKNLAKTEEGVRAMLARDVLTPEQRRRSEENLRSLRKMRRELTCIEMIRMPTPESSRTHRVVWTVGLTVLMPVLWPFATALLAVLFLLLGVVLVMMFVIATGMVLMLPYYALRGFPENTTETFKVTVPKAGAEALKKEISERGAQVESA